RGPVESFDAVVAIRQCTLRNLDACPVALAQPVEAQPPRCRLEVLDADINAKYFLELPLRHQPLQEFAAPTPEVDHAAGTSRLEPLGPAVEPLLMQPQRLLQPFFNGILGGFDHAIGISRSVGLALSFRLGRLELRKPSDGLPGEHGPSSEVSARYEIALRMAWQPSTTLGQQLLDLIRVDVVVLLQVENRDEHVKMVQKVGEAARRRQPKRDIWTGPPFRHLLVKRQGID